jgi:hypothetical protein
MSVENKKLNGLDGGFLQEICLGGADNDMFKSNISTDITLPSSIKLKLFSMHTRIFRVRLEYLNGGFIDIPISMERLEEWEKEIRIQIDTEDVVEDVIINK